MHIPHLSDRPIVAGIASLGTFALILYIGVAQTVLNFSTVPHYAWIGVFSLALIGTALFAAGIVGNPKLSTAGKVILVGVSMTGGVAAISWFSEGWPVGAVTTVFIALYWIGSASLLLGGSMALFRR